MHDYIGDNWQPWQRVVVAEWLRRWIRNPLGSPRAGSNPANNVTFAQFSLGSLKYLSIYLSNFSKYSFTVWIHLAGTVKRCRIPFTIG